MNSRPVLQAALLILAGIGISSLMEKVVPSAQAEGVGWQCYTVDRFDDLKDAQTWKGAKMAAEGLNQVAAHTAPGTLLELNFPTGGSWGGWGAAKGSVGVLCVKN